ncbi:MAG: cryptochrome/photolyase family protein [Methylococcales bacterium]
MRRLCIILGDQLDRDSAIFMDFDRQQDLLWMAEVPAESTLVWSHKQRIALFLSAMRHFAAELTLQAYPLHYLKLEQHHFHSLAEVLGDCLPMMQPAEVRIVRPGDYRVLKDIATICKHYGIPLKQLHDSHFLSTPQDFRAWAGERKQMRMEFWYRKLRKQHNVLMADAKQPLGGQWNYDHDNRKAFPKSGSSALPPLLTLQSDKISQEVMSLVQERFPTHPGSLTSLNWAVNPLQAQQALQQFLDHALPQFGDFQDAMWQDQPFLNHSLLASSLNLKLLAPLDVIKQAEERYRQNHAPMAAVEGFIRQILGWREYVRGLYWLHMPQWTEWNALDAKHDLPAFYWTGNTDMNCLRQAIGQTLQHGYAHHIQRLMVTGLFAQLYGVQPMQVHEWYLAVYVDAVEWVELPNTLGMSQYADGGLMASKPYIASGKYIQKMSNYCQHCRFNPAKATGADACPFTTLFWDFLDRHETRFAAHPRMGFMVSNLRRMSADERIAIKQQAEHLRG